jgi:hypothetical protein
MTETPPVTPTDPVDSGQSAPPTPTDQAAAGTQQEVAEQAPLGFADHRTYAMSLYQQPVWVVDAVFATDALDVNQQYTPAQVQGAIDAMMATPDKQFQEETA